MRGWELPKCSSEEVLPCVGLKLKCILAGRGSKTINLMATDLLG